MNDARIQVAGSALPHDTPAPATPHDIPHRGGPENPSAAALRARFGDAIVRSEVIWGETTIYIDAARQKEIVQFLRDEAAERYDYLVDVTAVEYRDLGRALEVVWHLRSLPYRRFLRLKVELDKRAPLAVDSIVDLYQGANWLEREVADMFGITFRGHPDPRRILMWESYREGHPLRKDFPLRGRFSRSEQLRQALTANPAARYDMEEIPPEEFYQDLPADMRERMIARGRED